MIYQKKLVFKFFISSKQNVTKFVRCSSLYKLYVYACESYKICKGLRKYNHSEKKSTVC